jgi:predicted ATPase
VSVWLRAATILGDEFPSTDRYPFDIPSLQGRRTLDFRAPVAFFVGENGCGKSTLIKALARRCGLHLWGQPERPLRSGELPATALATHLRVTLTKDGVTGGLFSADSFRGWAEFLDDVARLDPGQAHYHGGADLTARSHGEGILAYFRARYQVPGLYFLDEPESALSPFSQLELLRILAEYQTRGEAQFVIATHSPILMALPGGQVFQFSDGGIEETAFQSTAHFRLYHDFLADPGAFLPRSPE